MVGSTSLDVRLIGATNAIETTRQDIECAARTDAKVLITGETGAGKEVIARLIHQRSRRASVPLVTINCAGVPDSLLESELFGHVRGSFTGAYRDKPGLLEIARNGTVFLDEVGEMSTRMQTVLLRFLETGEIQRVGSGRPHTTVNVRLITATNRDLQRQIAIGTFREDLYYRLNVIRLHIPPLRERRGDIPLLVDHFLDMYSRQHGTRRCQLTPAAVDVMVAYRWRGNVRELKNVIERLTLKEFREPVRPTDLPAELLVPIPQPSGGTDNAASRDARSVAQMLAARLFEQHESFWTSVYPAFMSRDLTRHDLRKLIQIGLERTGGSYRMLVGLFNMQPADYKRFLTFLRKHDCQLPFQRFRLASASYRRSSAGDTEVHDASRLN
jgi:transcriptional regulator with GAF, ATPase, and Fis domain